MSYFSKFPKIPFSFGGSDASKRKTGSRNLLNQFDLVTNITLRFKISELFKSVSPIYDYYTITENERPDIIANTLYGDPNLHWVILIYNEIMNPNFEWPKDSITLQTMIDDNYKGSDIFLNVNGNSFYGDPCNCNKEVFASEAYQIEQGNKVRLTDTGGIVYSGEVLSWNSNLGILNVLFTRNNFKEEEINVNPSDYSSLEIDTTFTNGTKVTVELIGSTINIVKDKKYSLHHFEKDGIILNPFSIYENILEYETTEDPYEYFSGEVIRYQSGVINNYCFSDTLLGKYCCSVWGGELSNGDTEINTDYLVTNQKYEFLENEKKRTLVVPSGSSLQTIVKEYKKLFS